MANTKALLLDTGDLILDEERFERIRAASSAYFRKWTQDRRRDARPGLGLLLEELSGRCALAANAPEAIREALERNDLLRFFTHTEVSGDLGLHKPDIRFFQHILGQCGVGPEEALMIGDRMDNDVLPAKLLGMKTIWFRVGPCAVLEPGMPSEIPDATVRTVGEVWE